VLDHVDGQQVIRQGVDRGQEGEPDREERDDECRRPSGRPTVAGKCRVDAPGPPEVDPTDAPYVLDKENCRVKLDPEQTKLPIE